MLDVLCGLIRLFPFNKLINGLRDTHREEPDGEPDKKFASLNALCFQKASGDEQKKTCCIDKREPVKHLSKLPINRRI